MRPYTEIPGLAGLLLEESYVIDIEAHPGRIVFAMDLVLTVDHPEYRDPLPGEQYCYRSGELRFHGVSRATWGGQGQPPAKDSSGEIDYGNIDTFEWDPAGVVLEGGWGRMEVVATVVDVVLT